MKHILFIAVVTLLIGCNQKVTEAVTEKVPEMAAKVITIKKLGEVCEDILTSLDANQTPLILELHEIEADDKQLDSLYKQVAYAKFSEIRLGKGSYTKFECVEMMKSIFIKD